MIRFNLKVSYLTCIPSFPLVEHVQFFIKTVWTINVKFKLLVVIW